LPIAEKTKSVFDPCCAPVVGFPAAVQKWRKTVLRAIVTDERFSAVRKTAL
jgi:hypothetical protein